MTTNPPDDETLRVLVLMRHAEALDSSPDGDIGRELSPTGHKTAESVGQWLVTEGVRPDVVVVSPSVRTRQTWDALKRGGVRSREVWADAAVYDADTEDVVESVQSVPDDARTLVLIGHAPAVPFLVQSLEDHRERLDEPGPADGWPPAAVAVVSHRGSWVTFPSDDSAVVAFRRPA